MPDPRVPDKPIQPVRLGIVGCGAVARAYHIPALAQIAQIRVAVLCDRNIAIAKSLRKEFGLAAEVSDDPAELQGHADAALVAVPPRFHAAVGVRLLDLGIDVFCEKPLAVTAVEARTMVEVAEKNRRLLGVGLFRRFEPSAAILQKLVQNGLLGEIREITAELGDVLDWPMTTASYYSRETTGGGVFFDAGVHVVDLVCWLFGDIGEIRYEDDSYGGVESNAILRGMLNIRGREVPCHMAFSWTHALRNGISVVGAAGTAWTSFRDPNAAYLRQWIGGAPMSTRVYRSHKSVTPAASR